MLILAHSYMSKEVKREYEEDEEEEEKKRRRRMSSARRKRMWMHKIGLRRGKYAKRRVHEH